MILSTALAGISFAPWVPAWKKDLKRILALADLKPEQKFYELGSGTGRVCFYINKMTDAEAIGLEIALPFYLVSKFKQLFLKSHHIKFKFKNFFKQNLSDADVVYFFGMPKPLKDKLRIKLEKELKPGARVISYVFPIEAWQPKVIDKPKENDIAIYLYIR